MNCEWCGKLFHERSTHPFDSFCSERCKSEAKGGQGGGGSPGINVEEVAMAAGCLMAVFNGLAGIFGHFTAKENSSGQSSAANAQAALDDNPSSFKQAFPAADQSKAQKKRAIEIRELESRYAALNKQVGRYGFWDWYGSNVSAVIDDKREAFPFVPSALCYVCVWLVVGPFLWIPYLISKTTIENERSGEMLREMEKIRSRIRKLTSQ